MNWYLVALIGWIGLCGCFVWFVIKTCELVYYRPHMGLSDIWPKDQQKMIRMFQTDGHK